MEVIFEKKRENVWVCERTLVCLCVREKEGKRESCLFVIFPKFEPNFFCQNCAKVTSVEKLLTPIRVFFFEAKFVAKNFSGNKN